MLKKVLSGIACLKRSVTPHPLHVQWFLTRRCNYKCPSCQIWKQSPCSELNTEEVKRGVDTLQSMRVVDLVFTGGNPLLRNDIGEILRYAHDKFPLVSIYDNGSLAYKKVKLLRYVDKVCISLNTLNQKLQDHMSGVPGAFRNAIKSIEVLKKNDVGVVASATISKPNLGETYDLIKYFGERGIPTNLSLYSEVTFTDSPIKIGVEDDFLKFPSDGEMLNFIKQLEAAEEKYPVTLDWKTTNSLKKIFTNNQRDWKCNALGSFFIVNEEGYISGCHLKPPVCKIWELPEIWETRKMNELRLDNKQCEKCTYLCYITYSHLRSLRSLFQYFWEYEHHALKRASGHLK
ncbi:MAG: radical SAM protein [Candidatus Bathyarchaeota archaeon]